MTIIRELVPSDLMRIQRQPSQRLQLGLAAELTAEAAIALAAEGEAWTAERNGEPIACLGIRDTFEGVQGVAWAILSSGLGTAHLAITRHARRRIAASPLVRIEAIVRAACPAEVAWARLAGMEPAALLRKFGAASEDHILFERIR